MNYKASIEIIKIENTTKRDAKYFYYAHGPLARVEYGKNQVQGMDYAYTLQGWIKGVNSNTLSSSRDMGHDGMLSDTTSDNNNFAEDAMGYTLGYFAGDYKAISGVRWSSVTNRFEAQTAGSQFEGQRNDLFNGNISHMVSSIVATNADSATSLAKAQTPLPMANAYKYDQLNRLKKSLSFNNIDIPTNLWQASGQTVANMYENTFTFDANGNMLTQNRYDEAGVKFENMDYRYKKDVSGNFMQNRLYHVNDSASSGLQSDDIDDQGTFVSTIASINSVNNYRYDEIGNLIADSTEQIDTIKWTVFGKIKEIKRTSGSTKKNLKFDYDVSGSQIAKHVLSSSNSWEKSTYYVRDGQGNIMSTYEESAIDSSFSFKLKEQYLYGSSSLGTYNPEKEMIGADTTNEFAFDTLNKRQYELANHLGNVMTVTYDRKIAVDTNSDGVIDLRYADFESASDYTSFGGKLHNRGFEIQAYRMSFNGKPNDTETGTQDYGMRIYDPRLGRFLSIDPISKEYPELTTYQFAANTPLQAIDFDGLQPTGGTRPRINIVLYNKTPPRGYNIHRTYRPIVRPSGAPTPIPVYEKQTQTWDPLISKGNIPGQNAAVLGQAVDEFPAAIKNIKGTFALLKSTTNAHAGYGYGAKDDFTLKFDNPSDQAKFDKAQADYNTAYAKATEGISAPDMKNYDFSKNGESNKYQGDMAAYKLKVAIATESLGLSPLDQVKKYVENNKEEFKESVKTEEHSTISQGSN